MKGNNMNNYELYKGDCNSILKEIKAGSIDLVLCDPPYNISKDNNFTTMNRCGIDFGEWDKCADIISFIRDLPRVCNTDANVVIFNAWRNLGDIANTA